MTIDLDEIQRLEALEGSEINLAKKKLADAATAMAHGEEAARHAAQTAENLFEQGQAGGDLPVFEVSYEEISILDALVGIGFCASKGEAKRLVSGGGARIDGEPVSDLAVVISTTDGDVKISAGKKKHGLLRKVG